MTQIAGVWCSMLMYLLVGIGMLQPDCTLCAPISYSSRVAKQLGTPMTWNNQYCYGFQPSVGRYILSYFCGHVEILNLTDVEQSMRQTLISYILSIVFEVPSLILSCFLFIA